MPHDIPTFFRVLGTRCCIHCIALLSLEHNLTSFQRLVDLTLPQPGFHITMGHSAAKNGSNPPNMNKPWVHPRINQEESMSGCRDVGMSGCRDVGMFVSDYINMNKPRVHPQTIRNGEFIGMMFFFFPLHFCKAGRRCSGNFSSTCFTASRSTSPVARRWCCSSPTFCIARSRSRRRLWRARTS